MTASRTRRAGAAPGASAGSVVSFPVASETSGTSAPAPTGAPLSSPFPEYVL
ncbi:hypothetical protein [Streptomyces canus]|uniref:hypothetical protein n=1 Tax=Streptomyces canus TaxID=58343 RepID=UPI002DDADF79|nr:hypothetical protein [Streptomyces canus]WSD88255.1 hypothetical protein OG925_30010 [Streptomyces canus]